MGMTKFYSECIKLYGLGIDCGFRIISVEGV